MKGLVIRNVRIAGRRTSVRLESEMWEALHDIACWKACTVDALVTEIDRQREYPNLTAAIRSYIVAYYRDRLRGSPTDAGREIERIIAATIERRARGNVPALVRAILEELWEAGYEVRPRPDLIPIRRNPGPG